MHRNQSRKKHGIRDASWIGESSSRQCSMENMQQNIKLESLQIRKRPISMFSNLEQYSSPLPFSSPNGPEKADGMWMKKVNPFWNKTTPTKLQKTKHQWRVEHAKEIHHNFTDVTNIMQPCRAMVKTSSFPSTHYHYIPTPSYLTIVTSCAFCLFNYQSALVSLSSLPVTPY